MAETDDLQQQAPQALWRRTVATRLGGTSLNISSATGFLWVPNFSGVPTGIPSPTYFGLSPVGIDVTNNRFYFFSGGAWRNAGP